MLGCVCTFTITHDISAYTRASIFSKENKKTECFVRISSVAGERGAADAEEEGFTELAARFRRVAAIEKSHEERYRILLQNVEMQQLFEKSEQVMWECRICGHLVVGKKAPKVCPVCKYSQSYFEVRKENY